MDFISRPELSEMFMITERRISQLVEEGVLPKATKGKYPIKPTVTAFIIYLKRKDVRQSSRKEEQGENGTDLVTLTMEEELRLKRAKADIEELEAAQLKREMIPRADVLAGFTAMVSHCRARLLSIPTKAAPIVHSQKKIPEVEKTLKKFIYEALDELSNTPIIADLDSSDNEGGYPEQSENSGSSSGSNG